MRRVLLAVLCPVLLCAQPDDALFARAAAYGQDFARALSACHRLLYAWLRHADTKTLLLPDRIGPRDPRVYTPHNSGADLYPYLILTAAVTSPDLVPGRMMEMLRNEIRFASREDGVPCNLNLDTGERGPASLFGAGEYAKDGLIGVTELLGRTPWFTRMADMTAAALERSPVETRFGKIPANDSELNGDYLQTLARLIPMTRDPRFTEWAVRIARAYVEEILPGNHGLPAMTWDFARRAGEPRVRLRDHGNELIAGLTLLYAIEAEEGRGASWRPAVERMLGRVLESANPHGMLYNAIDASTLRPLDQRLSDNWGYVYGAVYTFFQATGETKYRDAVRRVLSNLGHYRNWAWEPRKDHPLGSFDGYADSIESAIYLVNREPEPEALAWIDSQMDVMLKMQRPDGHLEDWYGEGNFNRTALLWALMKSQGVRPREWREGLAIGAVPAGARLLLNIGAPPNWRGAVQFDFQRHKRVLNYRRNYVRLNEFPEWFTVEENALYSVERRGGGTQVWLGSELIQGIPLTAGEYAVSRKPPPQPAPASGNARPEIP
jgi:hypothetical protein